MTEPRLNAHMRLSEEQARRNRNRMSMRAMTGINLRQRQQNAWIAAVIAVRERESERATKF